MKKQIEKFKKFYSVILIIVSALTVFSCEAESNAETTSSEALKNGNYIKSGENYFYVSPKENMDDTKKELINLYNVCDNSNQAFLYAALPSKSDVFNIEDDFSSENEAELATALDTYYIDALHPSDFSEITKEDFRITDGAFTADGSYKIYKKLISSLDKLYSISYGVPTSIWNKANDFEKYEKRLLTSTFTGEYASNFPQKNNDGISYPTEEYSAFSSSTGRFTVRYERSDKKFSKSYGYFGEAVLNSDENLMKQQELDYVLSSNYRSMKISNSALDLEIIVLHNLSELSPIAYLSQNFGRVYAFDITNNDGMSASEYVASNSKVPVVMLLIDSSRPIGNLHSGKDVVNIGVENSEKAVRTATREVVPYIGKVDVTPMANNLINLEKSIKPLGADIIYISAPSKYIEGYTVMPEGEKHYSNENIDNFLSQIEGKVDYIDCRELFKEQNYPEEKWFYKTDHHWREESAFQAYIGCIEKLKNDYNWTDLDPDGRNTDRNNFNFELFTDYYVGSQTRDLNRYYIGYDDFYMITPKFDTNITYRRTPESGGMVRTGNYYKALIDQKYLDLSDPISNKYASYIGGDHNSNRILNSDPTCSDKRVLIVEDSFSLPFDCFMSLNFKELHIIDIRFYSLRTVSAYVKAYDIDMVLIVYTPEALYNRQVQFKFK